jgi:hypothetical protein
MSMISSIRERVANSSLVPQSYVLRFTLAVEGLLFYWKDLGKKIRSHYLLFNTNGLMYRTLTASTTAR